MSNPEQQPSAELEEADKLRSALADIFHTHGDKVVVHQADDWDQPMELILAGVCDYTADNGDERTADVQIRQRLDKGNYDYLFIVGQPGDYTWYRLTSTEADYVHVLGGHPMVSEDMEIARWLLQPAVTDWSEEEARKWTAAEMIFATADRYAGR